MRKLAKSESWVRAFGRLWRLLRRVRAFASTHRLWSQVIAPVIAGLTVAAILFLVARLCDDNDQPPRVIIDTASSMFNPPGEDRLADEYVCIINLNGQTVALTGWKLSDVAGHTHVFPRFELGGGGRVRVHTGKGTDTQTDLYWQRGDAVWGNEGDTVRLVDSNDVMIDEQSYPRRPDGDASSPCGDDE